MLITAGLRRKLLIGALSSATALLPGLAAVAPVGAAAIRVSPAVRAIVRSLRRIDIPEQWRRRNWIGDRGQGSCVHASLVHLLHWQGRHQLADWWQRRYANGETADGLASKLESAGVKFAETRDGDETFLEWAIRTRRGAAVVVQRGAHMVNLVGLDDRVARILDSNSPERIHELPRAEFLREWKASGGWAVTPVGAPPPPNPWIVK
jgi:hypothetical protein